MDKRLQLLIDHHAITETLRQYCQGCDRGDEERMAGAYLEDSFDDHGQYKAPGKQFAKIIMEQILGTTESMFHMLGQSSIEVKGQRAGAETYFLAVSRTKSADGTEMCNQLGGRFVDTLERENERWFIQHRVVVRDWAISMPIESDWTANQGLKDGQRSSADPAYAALGLAHSLGSSQAQ